MSYDVFAPMALWLMDVCDWCFNEGSLEVNFRQYGHMEKQRWDESEKRKEEEKNQRKSQKKEDAGKGRKVAKHCVFPVFVH